MQERSSVCVHPDEGHVSGWPTKHTRAGRRGRAGGAARGGGVMIGQAPEPGWGDLFPRGLHARSAN
eukprot:365270-Chlamydomonas_euryale.AAC.9